MQAQVKCMLITRWNAIEWLQSSMETAYQKSQSISDVYQISFHYTIHTLKQTLWIMGIKKLPFGQYFDGIQRNLTPERVSSRSHDPNWTETAFVNKKMARKRINAGGLPNQNSSMGHMIMTSEQRSLQNLRLKNDVKLPLWKFNGLELDYFG